MKNEPDIDLIRLFAEKGAPPQGEIFVERVSNRIARRRFAHRVTLILVALALVSILAVLTPWLMGLTGYIALGSGLLADSVAAVILSPVAWAVVGGVGLSIFLQIRPKWL
jgi:cell shape-determining protein MreD